eukprot:1122304-Pyramimonas_sp.AAC.1
MAATETVWDSSTKARTDLERRQSCPLGVSVLPIHEVSECDILDHFNLSNAFPTQVGKVLLPLQWPRMFRILLRGQDAGQDARMLLPSITNQQRTQWR